MPFPKLKFRIDASVCNVTTRSAKTDEVTGIVETKQESAIEELAPAEYWDIGNQVKAGMKLEEVNTKIVHETPINTARRYEEQVNKNIENANKKNEENEE